MTKIPTKMQDKDKNNSKEWERALCKFSKFSDGFFVLGFDNKIRKIVSALKMPHVKMAYTY